MNVNLRSTLLVSAVFAPLLALVVGLALLFRSVRADEAEAHLRLVEKVTEEILVLDHALDTLGQPGNEFAVADWVQKHAVVAWFLAVDAASEPQQRECLNRLRRDHALLGRLVRETVEFRSAARKAPFAPDENGEPLSIPRLCMAITGGATALADFSHRAITTQQVQTNALIIILTALLALIMAGLSYASARQEISKRLEVGDRLEQSQILLSDAFVRLRRAEQGVEHARVQALEEGARRLRSELSTHLSPILMIAETMVNYPEAFSDQTKLQRSMATISNSVRAARSAVDRLAEFSPEDGAMKPHSVDVNALVEDGLSYVQGKLGEAQRKHIRIQKQLADVLPPIDGVVTALRSALENILLNALEAMPSGGTLTVSTHAAQEGVSLAVSDTGKGMTEEVKQRCCDPFFSTKAEGGNGMGLALVAAVARRHRGSLDIQSQVNQGTTVTLHLPYRVVEGAATESSVARKLSRPLHILIVDDQPWLLQALEDIFLADGHTVNKAESGKQALGLFRAGHFDVVITDGAMPAMDGQQVAAAVKKLSPKTPVIMTTGLGDTILSKGLASKAVDLIVAKPVTRERIQQALAEVMSRVPPSADPQDEVQG